MRNYELIVFYNGCYDYGIPDYLLSLATLPLKLLTMVVPDPETELSHLSDEDYLVARSKLLRQSDPAASKSFMITAKLMFPNNFSIQFEAYNLEKTEGKSSEAAKYLRSMCDAFKSEKGLQGEIDKILTALDTKETPEQKLLADIFDKLPRETQQKILLDSAQKCGDTDTYAKQLIIAFERFPDLIPVHGAKLLSNVVAKCKKRPQNETLLKRLIMEICPKLLGVTQLKIDVNSLHDLLNLTIDFICGFLNKLARGEENSCGNPWPSIFSFLEEIGLRMGWSLTEDIGESAPDQLFQRIANFGTGNKHSDQLNELYFVTVIIFLRGLHDFLKESNGANVLVEAFVTPVGTAEKDRSLHQHPKRRKTLEDERKTPLITHGNETHSKLISVFEAAMKYYDFIRSDLALEAKFAPLKNEMLSFSGFFADVALFQGNFREALHILRALKTPVTDAENCKHHIKMATVQFCAGDHNTAADHLIQAVASSHSAADVAVQDREEAQRGAALKQATSVKNRHVHFMPFTRQNLLSYCARLLVFVLKDRGLQAIVNDHTLGHVIVLLQYIFPEESDLLFMLMNKIKVKETFSYPGFCTYVVHIDFLEEFAALLADASCKVALDITPTVSNQRRMGTRGANRGEKEEIRAALRRQVVRSQESLDEIVEEFLTKNRDSILQCLM